MFAGYEMDENIQDVENLIAIARGEKGYFVQNDEVFFVHMPYVRLERFDKKAKTFSHELVRSDSPKFDGIVNEFAGRIKQWGPSAYDAIAKVDVIKGPPKSGASSTGLFKRPDFSKAKESLNLRTFNLGIHLFVSMREDGKKKPRVASHAISYRIGFMIENCLHLKLGNHLWCRDEDGHYTSELNTHSINDFRAFEDEQAALSKDSQSITIKFLNDWLRDHPGNSRDCLNDFAVRDLMPESQANAQALKA